MLSEEELARNYISSHLEYIKEKIKNSDYNGEINDILQKVLKYLIATKNIEDLIWFSKNIENAPTSLITNKIIELGRPEHLCMLAKEGKNIPINRIIDYLNEHSSVKYLYEIAVNVPLSQEQIDKIMNIIIERKNSKYIYLFALTVKNANKEVLYEALKELEAKEMIEQFERNIINYQNTEEEIKKALDNRNLSLGEILSKKKITFRRKILEYLYKNINYGNNELIIRVYYKLLTSNDIGEEEVKKLDIEYANELLKNTHLNKSTNNSLYRL